MRIWLSLIVCFFSFQVFAEEVSSSFDIPYIEVFDYEGSGRIEIQQGVKNSFVMSGESRLMGNTRIKVADGVLSVKPVDVFVESKMTDVIEGKLIVKNLKKILLNGSVAVDIDQLKGENLFIKMGQEGSTLIEGNIEYERLAVSMFGGCNALLKGKVKTEMIYLRGAGAFEGQELVAKDAKVWIHGAGTVIVNVEDSLGAKVFGSGHVHYIGNPPIIHKHVQGNGKVAPFKGILDR